MAVNALDDKNKVIRFLMFIIGGLFILVVHAHITVANVPREFTSYTPPDLSVGGKTRIGEAPKITAYNFAYTVFAGMHTWTKDGSLEYEDKIDRYRYYISGTYANYLRRVAARDFEANKGRRRTVEFVPTKFKVNALGNNRFEVRMLVRVIDEFKNVPLKDEYIQYSFLVTPHNVLRSMNPWQLKIEGEYAPSVRVEAPDE